jgi:serine protease Do
MSWICVGLFVFFICAAAFTALVAPISRNNEQPRPPLAKSYVGVNDFKDTDQGVMLDHVSVPGGPADAAGLIGGDIILSFDGQQVQNDDQLDDLMVKTPIGKTVDVEYMRDGEKKKTSLTTVDQEENRRLYRLFERRPEGRTQLGYEDDDAERVMVPGMNIYGVKLGTILRSRPADIAGLKEGDIVVEFDGVPIRTSEEFLMRVRRAQPYSTVKLVVMRGEAPPLERVEIPVKLGKQ